MRQKLFKKIATTIWYILTIFVFTSCNPQGKGIIPREPNMPTITVITTQNEEVRNTFITVTPTSKIDDHFQTLSPTSVINNTPTVDQNTFTKSRIKKQCLNIEQNPSKELVMKGVLVLKKVAENGSKPNQFILLNLKTGKTTLLNNPGEEHEAQKISPDRQRMAFLNLLTVGDKKPDKKELVIIDEKGDRLKVIPWLKNWAGLSGWLDNKRLGIILVARNEDEFLVHKPALSLLFNPLTGENKILDQDYPNILYDSSVVLPGWEGWYGIVYDNALSLAIYPTILMNDKDNYTYALRDLSTQRTLATFENIILASKFARSFPIPRWSPDNSLFIMKGILDTKDGIKDELYRVDRTGKSEQLTYLSNIFTIWDGDYNWSPDGRHISLILGEPIDPQEGKAHLAVLDTKTFAITDFCFPITFVGEGFGNIPPLNAIWSPDGKQLVIQDWVEKGHSRVIVVDIENGIAAQIAENVEPIGWMSGENK